MARFVVRRLGVVPYLPCLGLQLRLLEARLQGQLGGGLEVPTGASWAGWGGGGNAPLICISRGARVRYEEGVRGGGGGCPPRRCRLILGGKLFRASTSHRAESW